MDTTRIDGVRFFDISSISRHISIGAGGYLAFAGSVALALQGARHFRRHAA